MITPAQALVGFLQAQAALMAQVPGGVWIDVAPQDGATPQLLVMQGRMPVSAGCAGQTTVSIDDGDLAVWVFGTGEQVDALNAIAAAVTALLHRQRWDAGEDWVVTKSRLVEMFERVRHDGSDARWHALGRLFRVALQER